MTDLAIAVVTIVVLSIPLALSVWALLDAARRPRWVWAFAGRTQVLWMAMVMFGAFLLPIGLFVSIRYLTRVRPQLAAIEEGRLDAGGPDQSGDSDGGGGP